MLRFLDAPVAIVNRSAAARYGGHDVLGLRLHVSDDEPRTIVGIVGDIRHGGLYADEGAVLYVPYAQKTFAFLNWMGFVVRSAGPPPSLALLSETLAQTRLRERRSGARLGGLGADDAQRRDRGARSRPPRRPARAARPPAG